MRSILLWLSCLVLLFGSLAPMAAAQETSESPEPDEEQVEEETQEESSGSQWSFKAYLDEAHSWGIVTLTVGPDSMRVDWTGIQLGEQASTDVRALADGAFSGEADGAVEASEADDFLFALGILFEREFAKIANHRSASGLVLIDQAEAQKVSVDKVLADGLVGPTDQAGIITASLGLKIDFPNVDKQKDIHTVRLDLGNYYLREPKEGEVAKFAGDLTLVVQAADAWTLDAASIQPGCAADTYTEGHLTFTADDAECFTGRSGVLLTFAITGQGERDPNFLPSTGLIASMAGLLGAAFLRRRL